MKLTLNLASRSYLNQRALKQFYQVLCLLLLLLLAFQVKSYLHSRNEIRAAQNSLDELRQQLRGTVNEPLATEQIAAQKLQFQRARSLLQRDAFRWSALFDQLEKILPDGISIRSFNPNYKERELILIGVAKGLKDLQKLMDRLHAEPYQQVFLQNQSQVEVNDGVGGKRKALSFSIKLEGVF